MFKGQTFTEVWASGLVELNTEAAIIHHSIDETFDYICSLDTDMIIYYHNLKFDGNFWLSYLLTKKHFKQAYTGDFEHNNIKWKKTTVMKNKEVKYSISNKLTQWYTLTFKVGGHVIELRDSMKLLPFSVERIGKSFGTKHKKSSIVYTGFRYAGCPITDEEILYLKNDLLVVKEALEIMFKQGHDKLTIGACCFAEYKNSIKYSEFGDNYDDIFPSLYDFGIDPVRYTQGIAGEYIRKAYRGGWCYLVKGKENKVFENGITIDVNSLYPSVMSSESGNRYPYGEPIFWHGNYLPKELETGLYYYFIRIKTRFKLKDGFLPTIQIKNNLLYRSTEWLETSDYYEETDGKYYRYRMDRAGNLIDSRQELTLTMTDFELLKRHYKLEDFEIISGCYFKSRIGMFDYYIDKYKEIKQNSAGAVRESAKLFLNNLYGKFATNTDSSFKIAYVKDDDSLGYVTVLENDKKPGFIAVGAAVTSYARYFTITAAQLNYKGKDKPGFIYADTDSLHLNINIEELKGVKEHKSDFCCWKFESQWDKAIFVRQKTYIEHITHDGRAILDKSKYQIKCAGMPEKCKQLLVKSFDGEEPTAGEYTDEELEVIKANYTITDFKRGLKIPGKLIPKRIPGGVLLVETTYEMR